MKSFSITDIGMLRSMNQDAFYTSERPTGSLPNLFIVADGMGGHNAGEYASTHTVDTMVEVARASSMATPEAVLEAAIKAANENLLRQASLEPSMWGMGTTVVAAVVAGDRLHIANVGDSRLYIAGDALRQVTLDHSLVEEMVRKGKLDKEAARTHPDKNMITRAVGAVKEIEIDFFKERLREGDKVLLCSDGLTNMVEDDEIYRIITEQKDTKRIAERLVQEANRNGGKDNITVTVIDPFFL